MSSESPTRRLTRSQTGGSVLGKRTASFTHPSSTTSSKANRLPTPESTPNAKKARTGQEAFDSRANKENIPPLRNALPESPSARRSISRRSSFSSDISTISISSRRSVSNLRRHATQPVIPQTPSKAADESALASPPATPQTTIPLPLRVRGLLRATSNSNHSMSFDGRENERMLIESFLTSFDDTTNITEPVLYVSGTPGTGKTALVNAIISANASDDIKIIFLNCMSINGMDVLWARLTEELHIASKKGSTSKRAAGKKTSGRDEIAAFFEKHRNMKCVIILDELDSLTGISANAILPLFSLAASYSSSVRIMGIANTHTLTSASSIVPLSLDLSDSMSSSKAEGKKSTQIKTVHFAPYTPAQLLAILNKRLEALPQDELRALLPPPTLTLLTKKVSALTGDVRVLFEVLRGAIDLAVPSGSQALANNDAPKKPASVTPAHVLASLKSFQPATPPKGKSAASSPSTNSGIASNSETATKVRGLGLQARLVLLSLVLASRRALASLPLSASSSPFNSSLSSPSTRPSSPSKRPRSPIKRTSSNSSTTPAHAADAAAKDLDATQLHAFYTALLSSTAGAAFTPVSRPDFTDLLGLLETSGLLALSGPSSVPGTPRALKRATSFAGFSPSRGKGQGAKGTQTVGLLPHVREAEVVRGLGIGAGEAVGGEGDVLEDDVRAIWAQEMGRIRREAKTRETLAALEGVDNFEDAVQF